MSLTHLQPDTLFPSARFGFTQVVTSPPGKLVFVAGQTALDRDFKAVGTDLGTQAEQAFTNLGHALEAAGATFADVAHLRVFIANYKPEHAAALGPLMPRFFGDGPLPAQTLIGAQALAMPELLIEIEAVAVVPD